MRGEKDVPVAMWLSETVSLVFCCHRKVKGDRRFPAHLFGMDDAKNGKLSFVIKIEWST